jgi:phosphate transport system substrate-binding protein
MHHGGFRAAMLTSGLLASALLLSACGGQDAGGGQISIDGSSTVFPLTATAAEDFQLANPEIRVKVGNSGTGGGFDKFCRGETDGNDASRSIKDSEIEDCTKSGITFGELQVAVDALTVVVNVDNTWVTCLTLEQLAKIWGPENPAQSWRDVDPNFPDVPLKLFGPGTDSGTFDYFTDVINGEEGASRTDFTPSEDDNVIVQGVEGSRGGLGYFGFTYFEENRKRLKAVAIDAGDGCVMPSVEAAQDGTYTPLSRPLFIYASVQALAKPPVKAFFDYFIANDAEIAEGALFIPLNKEQKAKLQAEYDALVAQIPVTP